MTLGSAAVPINFLIGSASAALQIEGGELDTNWHDWAATPGNVTDGTTPERATDHWNRWEEDNQLMSDTRMQIARIGLEWARIEPERGRYDYAVLDRYRIEIADLIDRGIHPLVTLHHFTNPLWVQNRGEFTRPATIDDFLAYVRVTVGHLGDLVTDWITINEPNVYAVQSYLFKEGPPGEVSWPKLFKVLGNLAEAHCRAYLLIHEIIDDDARRAQVTFAHHMRVFMPRNPANPVHRAFTWLNDLMFHRIIEKAFFSGVFHPLLGGRRRDLPLARYADAIGLNYYSRTATSGFTDSAFDGPLTDLGWEIYPEGLVTAARELHERYPLPIWVTENGCADNGRAGLTGPGGKSLELEHFRSAFLLEHLGAMATSGLPFQRYYHWCFVDNWEWSDGEVPRFGIIHLDYETQTRTIKPSGRMLADIIEAGAITAEIRGRYYTGYTSAIGVTPLNAQ